MRDTSWHDCLSHWVKIWSAQTCDIDSLLIVILMWSEGACMWTPPFPKHPGTCNSTDTCCGRHSKTFTLLGVDSMFFPEPPVTPRGHSPLISILGFISTGQLWGRAFYSKSLLVVWVCLCMLYVCVFLFALCIRGTSVCMCCTCMCVLVSYVSHYRPQARLPPGPILISHLFSSTLPN